MAFTHLHVHTEYSLLDGSGKIKEMVAQAKALGCDSLAITDHGAMYGVIDFYRAAKEAGIKPIIGCEIYVTNGSRFDREISQGDDRYYHLVLLAENNQGYSNLMKIVSTGFTEGFYYKPRVDYETLEKYSGGLIASSACLAGIIIATGIHLFIQIVTSSDQKTFDWKILLITAVLIAVSVLFRKNKQKPISPILLILLSAIIGMLFL